MRRNAFSRFRRAGKLLAVPLVLLASAVVFLAKERSLPYRKGANWQSTIYAALEQMHDPADPLDGVVSGVWRSSRFYPEATLETVLPPETNDPSVRWVEHPEWRHMARREIKASGRSVVYDRCSLHAESARTVTLYVAPTGTAVVWLNGKELMRGAPPPKNLVSLLLEKGANDLLIKVFNPGPHPMNPDPRYTISLFRPFEVRNRYPADLLD